MDRPELVADPHEVDCFTHGEYRPSERDEHLGNIETKGHVLDVTGYCFPLPISWISICGMDFNVSARFGEPKPSAVASTLTAYA